MSFGKLLLLPRDERLYAIDRHVHLTLGTAKDLTTSSRDHVRVFVRHRLEVLAERNQGTLVAMAARIVQHGISAGFRCLIDRSHAHHLREWLQMSAVVLG